MDLYRSLADCAYDWIYLRAADGSLTYTSPSCMRVTGYGPQDFARDPRLLERIVHPDDRPLFLSHLKKEAGSEEEISGFDFRIITSTGETRWINHACAGMKDGRGRIVARRATNRDVTRRKELEAEV
ncbi:MAG TPA: PAS domain-containing protein, partial [Spirochaetia bacterium]|nr:PAS domain-containing protein [Spirochaetia bacterium]